MRNWLQRFMIGRYGPDQLYIASFFAALVFAVLGACFRETIAGSVLQTLGYVLLIFALFRFLSRNLNARRRENDRFLRFWVPVRNWFKSLWQRARFFKTHRFFRCPGCRNLLRLPRGKGKIEITCPRCGQRFRRKT